MGYTREEESNLEMVLVTAPIPYVDPDEAIRAERRTKELELLAHRFGDLSLNRYGVWSEGDEGVTPWMFYRCPVCGHVVWNNRSDDHQAVVRKKVDHIQAHIYAGYKPSVFGNYVPGTAIMDEIRPQPPLEVVRRAPYAASRRGRTFAAAEPG